MRPERRHTLCASLSSRNAFQHVTRAAPYGNFAADQSEEHPDQAPAFTPTVRTPQCGQTVWGIKRQTATACQRVTSELLDLSLARAHGHPGTTPIHGHTGTRAQPRSTGTRAHGQSPPENQPPTGVSPTPHLEIFQLKKIWFIMVSPGPGCMHVCIYIYMYVRTSKMKGCAIYHLWAKMWHPEDPPHFFWKPKKHVGVVYFMWSGEIFLRNLLSYPPKYSRVKGGDVYVYVICICICIILDKNLISLDDAAP